MGPFLVQRAVEDMLGSNSLVFSNEALLARARQLKLTTEKDHPKQDKKEDRKEETKEDKEDKKKGGKPTKHVSSSSSAEEDEE